jgi:hypothetical protein
MKKKIRSGNCNSAHKAELESPSKQKNRNWKASKDRIQIAAPRPRGVEPLTGDPAGRCARSPGWESFENWPCLCPNSNCPVPSKNSHTDNIPFLVMSHKPAVPSGQSPAANRTLSQIPFSFRSAGVLACEYPGRLEPDSKLSIGALAPRLKAFTSPPSFPPLRSS